MKKVKLSVVLFATLFFASCGGNSEEPEVTNETQTVIKTEKIAEEPEETIEEELTEEVIEETGMSDSKGVGPITSIELGEIDETLAEKGKEIFKANCTACHKISKRFVGPALAGVTERRTPEWIMNMILNPEGMVAEDQIAMDLLAEYASPMANQGLTEEEARAILEYFRTKN